MGSESFRHKKLTGKSGKNNKNNYLISAEKKLTTNNNIIEPRKK
jgi:hypothetical protein